MELSRQDANRVLLQKPFNLAVSRIYVKGYGSCNTRFWLNRMNNAFHCCFVKEYAVSFSVFARKSVCLVKKRIFNVNVILFQISFDDFSAFSTYGRSRISATANITISADNEEIVLSFAFGWHKAFPH
jgi:hypothetical protein